jgi:hypothetical protein
MFADSFWYEIHSFRLHMCASTLFSLALPTPTFMRMWTPTLVGFPRFPGLGSPLTQCVYYLYRRTPYFAPERTVRTPSLGYLYHYPCLSLEIPRGEGQHYGPSPPQLFWVQNGIANAVFSDEGAPTHSRRAARRIQSGHFLDRVRGISSSSTGCISMRPAHSDESINTKLISKEKAISCQAMTSSARGVWGLILDERSAAGKTLCSPN